ncbi:hypothetical protein [Granulosicoccus antarcticus]|uniref:Uncharacterized protein n=1 Tax=Granulosicoccus antarcticus IMCC3135 TaxID=1192854 RepID=A0A2Z2NLE7_9GAMM|nr:hypothetical protein [Granulosicoccus antarcticus]ASJ70608.1 hypothetical protein IMCC3135_02475 [Granulosicoccus antarcticus IMCC3135]
MSLLENVEATPIEVVGKRGPDTVMRMARLGSFHQTRVSFMRSLLRRLRRENWRFERNRWQINAEGVGFAVYTAYGPRRNYSLVAFAHDLPPEMRSDRVIATAWDATFCLFDGIPTEVDIQRLQANVPLQEAGRISDSELSLSRANRSVRLWAHVVERLAAGEQPDAEQIDEVGYLIRTTAVYGSGKFGAADRYRIQDRMLAGGPFRIEMLSVYLTRAFSLDLVEHMAKQVGGDKAVALQPDLRRRFGVGNSTGLGMAPFLINHPLLLHRWIDAKETALQRVRQVRIASDTERSHFLQVVARASLNAYFWHSAHPLQVEKLQHLRHDMDALQRCVTSLDLTGEYVWNKLYLWSEQQLSLEGQEQLVSLLLEPYGALVDDLSANMWADEYAAFRINGTETVAILRERLKSEYHWALDLDYTQHQNSARFWYVSEEKMEPRIGERYEEEGTEFEQPLDIGRAAAQLYQALNGWDVSASVADFLLAAPEHRHMVRRIQLQAKYPYAEIRDNLIAADMLPIDLLRCKLSFFGATHFDPRSDRWVRICMFQHAPFPHELAQLNDDDWVYPPVGEPS